MANRLSRFVDHPPVPTNPSSSDHKHDVLADYHRRVGSQDAGLIRIATFHDLNVVLAQLDGGGDRSDLRRKYGKKPLQIVLSMAKRIREVTGGNGAGVPVVASSTSLLDGVLQGKLSVDRLTDDEREIFANEVFTRAKTADSLPILLEQLNVTSAALDTMFQRESPPPPRGGSGQGAPVLSLVERNKQETPVERIEPECVAQLVSKDRTVYDLTAAELAEVVNLATDVSEYGMNEGSLIVFLRQCELPLTIYRELMRLNEPETMLETLHKRKKRTIGYAAPEAKRKRPPPDRSEPPPTDPDAITDESSANDSVADASDEEGREEEFEDVDEEDSAETDSSLEAVERLDVPDDEAIRVPADKRETSSASIMEDPKGLAALRVLLRALPYYYVENDQEVQEHRQALCECFGIEETALGLSPQESSARLQFHSMKEMSHRKHHPALVASVLYLRLAPSIKRGGIGKLNAAFSLFPGDAMRWQKGVSEKKPLFDLGRLLDSEQEDAALSEDYLQPKRGSSAQGSSGREDRIPNGDSGAVSILQDPKGMLALRILIRALPYYLHDPDDAADQRRELCMRFGVLEDELGLSYQEPSAWVQFRRMSEMIRRRHGSEFIASILYLRDVPYKKTGAMGALNLAFSLGAGDVKRWKQNAEKGDENPLFDLGSLIVNEGGVEDPPKATVSNDSPQPVRLDTVEVELERGNEKREVTSFVADQIVTPDIQGRSLQNEPGANNELVRELLQQNAAMLHLLQQQAAIINQFQSAVSQRAPVAPAEGMSVVRVVIDVQVNNQGMPVQAVHRTEPLPVTSPKFEEREDM